MARRVADAPDTPGCRHAGWEAATWDDGGHVHVLPLEDAVAHDEDPDGSCICGPVLELVPATEDRPDGWLISHCALDGRID